MDARIAEEISHALPQAQHIDKLFLSVTSIFLRNLRRPRSQSRRTHPSRLPQSTFRQSHKPPLPKTSEISRPDLLQPRRVSLGVVVMARLPPTRGRGDPVIPKPVT